MLLTAAERAIENPESAEEIPLSEKTGFAKAIRLHPAVFSFGSFVCRVPKDDLVEFYQLIPLFEEESDLIEKKGFDDFLDLCYDKHLEVINPERQNVVLDQDGFEDNATEMDKGEEHLQKIAELGLAIDDICAFNHMAIYLYWSIQHDLMSNPFNHKIGMDRYMPTVQAVLGREAFPQAGPSALNPLRIMEVGKAVGSLLWGTK